MYNTVFFIIIAFFVLTFLFEQFLSWINQKNVKTSLPKELEGIYNAEEYKKQQAYFKTNEKFDLVKNVISFVVYLFILCFGLFGWLDGQIESVIAMPILITLTFFGILFVLSSIFDLPFDYYSTFTIEEKFGFNKSTKKIFWTDFIKSILMNIVLMEILLFLIAEAYQLTGNYFWLIAWGIMTAFSVFLNMFYSELIVPLFNKQTPLEDGSLKQKINDFCEKAGFVLKNVYVIDGSKRSTKANAYFSGLGSKKRVVLYDTLINDLTEDEIVAVLAHEIGHYKKKHTLQNLIFSIANTGVILFLMSLFLESEDLAIAMGAEHTSFHINMLAFMLLYTPISMLLNILFNVNSRKNEYQADAFAASFGLGEELISALKKLSVKSLSNLQPASCYVFVYYSHPTLLQRIKAIKKNE